MGTGKTSAMIQKMNLEPDKNYLFVTPYIDEIERIIAANASGNFKQPEYHGKFHTKLDDLHNLLASGENIAMTHALFLLANKQTERLILEGDYVLILDEALDVLHSYNEDMIRNQRKIMDEDDPDLLLTNKFIEVDEQYNVHWIKESTGKSNHHFSEIRRLSNREMLRYINGSFYWEYPPDIFQWFSKIYILTYMFENTVLDCYFKTYGLQYVKVSAEKSDGSFRLCDFTDAAEQKEKFSSLINIYDGKYNELGAKRNAFSINWLRQCKPEKLEEIRKAMRNYKNSINAPTDSVMWTTTKQFGINSKLEKAGGFKFTHILTQEEKNLPPREQKKLLQFVPCNARATNEYRNRTTLMYMLNYYMLPDYEQYFKARGYDLNLEKISLSVLIQWIWRSAIRDGKPINLFLPSSRMRRILCEWLGKPVF